MPILGPDQARLLLTSAAQVAGRGAGRLAPAAGGATGGAARVGAVVGGAAVAVLWASACGLINLRKYKKGEISKKEAAQRTAAESVCMGLTTAAGIAAVNVVRASTFVAGSGVLAPFLVGTAVTGAAKAAWEHHAAKRTTGLATPGMLARDDIHVAAPDDGGRPAQRALP